MAMKYYSFINTVAQVDFDEAGDPSFCEIYDLRTKQFTRRNDMLDDILNHPQTEEVDAGEFGRLLKEFGVKSIPQFGR